MYKLEWIAVTNLEFIIVYFLYIILLINLFYWPIEETDKVLFGIPFNCERARRNQLI